MQETINKVLNERTIDNLIRSDMSYYDNGRGGPWCPGVYFLLTEQTLANIIDISNLSADVADRLLSMGWEKLLYRTTLTTDKNNKQQTVNPPFDGAITYHIDAVTPNDRVLFAYKGGNKHIVVKIVRHECGSPFCSAVVSYSSQLNAKDEQDTVEFIKNTFLPFVEEKKKNVLHILIKDEYNDLSFKPFEVSLPENIDLAKSYGKDFVDVHNKILKKLEHRTSGLYLLHGAPGTGKSTYIKYLAGACKNKKFVYVPEFMVPLLNQPDIIRLLMSCDNLVLIIEDAEKIIKKRDGNESNMVSTLLNLSDGILSDILKMTVILTYNTTTDDIDSALLRKGRLQYKHEFMCLNYDQSIDLLKHSGVTNDQINDLINKNEIKSTMTIADIINITDDIGVLVNDKEKKLGF